MYYCKAFGTKKVLMIKCYHKRKGWIMCGDPMKKLLINNNKISENRRNIYE